MEWPRSDLLNRNTFGLEFLALMEMENEWPWKILQLGEAHSHLKKIYQCAELPNMGNRKFRRKSTSTTSFYKDSTSVYFILRLGLLILSIRHINSYLMDFSVTLKLYECIFHNHIIPGLPQHECVDGIPFKQNETPPQIANLVKQLLEYHFGNGLSAVISLQPVHPFHLILIQVISGCVAI